MSGFIKNIDLLDEDYRLNDLLNLDDKKQEFLDRFSYLKKSSLIGVIAPFGSGKTTFLNQIKKDLEDEAHWMNFDAWKYPDRQDLWENFVLEFSRSINIEAFDEAFSKIEGTQDDGKKALINTVGDIPFLGAIKNFSYFLKTTPAKRTFELQDILNSLLEKVINNNIYIVVEDIDRSGDAGIFFLETLNYFIKSNPSSKKIIVLVSIGSEQRTLNLNSYLKCLDYSRDFNLEGVVCNRFVDGLFDDNLFDVKIHERGQMQTFFEGYFKEFSNQATMRLLKKCLREANLNYTQLQKRYGEVIDYRLCIMIEVAKNTFIDATDNKPKISYYNLWKTEKEIGGSDSIFAALIYCIIQENHRIKGPKQNDIYGENYSESLGTYRELLTISSLPIKIKEYLYPKQDIQDSVLYYTYSRPSDKNNNCFVISSIYF